MTEEFLAHQLGKLLHGCGGRDSEPQETEEWHGLHHPNCSSKSGRGDGIHAEGSWLQSIRPGEKVWLVKRG